MQAWRFVVTLALLVGLFGALDLSLLKTRQSRPATCVFGNPEAPVLCASPDHASRIRPQFLSPFLGPEPWLPACVGRATANIVWHYTNALYFWVVPFMLSSGLQTPVEQ
ncbi:unnamed protein product [Ectocarpus sp. CCAP 1310/34]|nr:unnamed protein product [Ectocarpus sp. CCAP 1310/34]